MPRYLITWRRHSPPDRGDDTGHYKYEVLEFTAKDDDAARRKVRSFQKGRVKMEGKKLQEIIKRHVPLRERD